MTAVVSALPARRLRRPGAALGPSGGDLFGRAARRFEEMGIDALLINCLPVEHVPGMIPWLRVFTTLPLGVYPNLGMYTGLEWRFDEAIDPAEYGALAREWREEGARSSSAAAAACSLYRAALGLVPHPHRRRGRRGRVPTRDYEAGRVPRRARTPARPASGTLLRSVLLRLDGHRVQARKESTPC